MRFRLGSLNILLVGAAITLAVIYWQNTKWYGFIFTPFVIWAWLYSHPHINVDGRAYRLARRYFKDEVDSVCKVCPFWGFVALSLIIGFFHVLGIVLLNAVAHLGYYAVVGAGWLLGYKPTYWRGLFMLQDKETHVFRGEMKKGQAWNSRTYYVHDRRFPPLFWVALLAAGVLFTFGIDGATAHWAASQLAWLNWVNVWPVIYFGIIALIVIGNAWQRLLLPTIRWGYRKSCPDLVRYRKARATAKPKKPGSAQPQRG